MNLMSLGRKNQVFQKDGQDYILVSQLLKSLKLVINFTRDPSPQEMILIVQTYNAVARCIFSLMEKITMEKLPTLIFFLLEDSFEVYFDIRSETFKIVGIYTSDFSISFKFVEKTVNRHNYSWDIKSIKRFFYWTKYGINKFVYDQTGIPILEQPESAWDFFKPDCYAELAQKQNLCYTFLVTQNELDFCLNILSFFSEKFGLGLKLESVKINSENGTELIKVFYELVMGQIYIINEEVLDPKTLSYIYPRNAPKPFNINYRCDSRRRSRSPKKKEVNLSPEPLVKNKTLLKTRQDKGPIFWNGNWWNQSN